MKKLPEDDLQHVLDLTAPFWKQVTNSTFFITGGTGFFGKWLVSSLLYINNKLGLNNKVIVLTRSSDNFLKLNPWFEREPAITFITGDVRDFPFPNVNIDYIIHAATEASVTLNINEPLLMYDVIVEGTRNILEMARLKGVKGVLHTSSGAVYGAQPSNITHLPENFIGCPDVYQSNAAYAEGKRVAEMLAAIYKRKHNVSAKIARCYAFSGPYLPLNGTFAFGNFIEDVLANRDINLSGDGTAYRSYLYASDLVVWLLTILFAGDDCMPYNVGSDEDVTIADLARTIAKHGNRILDVKIAGKPILGVKPLRYVPDVSRCKNQLGLRINVSLEEGIKKTLAFYKQSYE
jgi:dTDP-glucose 4,6-dehydratase